MHYLRRVGKLPWNEMDQERWEHSLAQTIQVVGKIAKSPIQFARVADRPVGVRVTKDWISVVCARTERTLYETSNSPAGPARVRNWIEERAMEVVSTDG
jgi:hypothetical protein